MIAGALVERYYAQIDADDVDGVLTLFHDDAVYHRADSLFVGKPRIAKFFRHERLIRGEHRIEKILSLGDEVVVIGRFEGEGAFGDARSIGFVDLWSLDEGKVRGRRTYLATGHEVVQQ
ncbi:nuclear transport factor 2 family protein [Novosphingobium sp. Gsoil 351]|uniref:nuclear transport factor 2 family protein n=1 Tax=Novosphingobium sp. Gsoil 351 TaxID=2675225 RepID=UPI0012B4C005|nr:nuclear transport factor 2 family protein [Novosphingobium sp. Gsoil 351]QGN55641.1 DUF4440 domain-containing protein [Novosphingobium sp. Gsoil 351]